MRHLNVTLMAALCVMALGVNSMADDKVAWLDLEKCEFCEAWSADPDLKGNLDWKMQETSDGVLSVISVKADHALAFHKANSAYDNMLQKITYKGKQGDEVQLCGSCETLVSFFPRGVKMNHMNAGTSHIMLLSSGNKRVVADLHKWAQRNVEELAEISFAQDNE